MQAKLLFHITLSINVFALASPGGNGGSLRPTRAVDYTPSVTTSHMIHRQLLYTLKIIRGSALPQCPQGTRYKIVASDFSNDAE